MRNYKNTVIAILLGCILTMAIGYAVLQQRLNVTGTANVSSEFNIQITGINEFLTNQLAETASLSYTRNSATFSTNLQAPGDNAIYEVVVENLGNLAGYSTVSLLNYHPSSVESDVYFQLICVTTSPLDSENLSNFNFEDCLDSTYLLKSGEKVYYYVQILFDDFATALPVEKNYSYTFDFLFTQTVANSVDQIEYLDFLDANLSNYLAINEWFNDMDPTSIETITFTNSNVVPTDSSVVDSFDISNSNNGAIMAWYYDIDDDNLYEVYIGQKGGVIANPDSTALFSTLTNLTEINGLEYFDTSQVTNMSGMFAHTENLKTLDLTSFDTSNVISMTGMFAWAYGLETLDLSSFDTSKVLEAYSLFYGDKKLRTIYVSDLWDLSNLIDKDDALFYDCISLVGGSGTQYVYPNYGLDMANYQTGYFTYKNN